jgi:hypothetical protein
MFPKRRSLIASLAVVLIALAGCGRSGQTAPPVDPGRALEALKTTLESWKNGETPEQLKGGPAAITAQDFDWMAGFQLVDYQIESEGQNDDANLRVPVSLTMKDPSGKEVKKQVKYVVGTAPAVTVFRDMF